MAEASFNSSGETPVKSSASSSSGCLFCGTQQTDSRTRTLIRSLPARSGQASYWLVEFNNVSFTSSAVFPGMSAGSFSETAACNRAYNFYKCWENSAREKNTSNRKRDREPSRMAVRRVTKLLRRKKCRRRVKKMYWNIIYQAIHLWGIFVAITRNGLFGVTVNIITVNTFFS